MPLMLHVIFLGLGNHLPPLLSDKPEDCPQHGLEHSHATHAPHHLPEENPALHNMKFLNFFFFLFLWVIFVLHDLDPLTY
jgi:hypothetical protein